MEKIRNVHVIGIRSKTKLTRAVLDNAKELLAIGCFCICTEQVDLQAAAEKGVSAYIVMHSLVVPGPPTEDLIKNVDCRFQFTIQQFAIGR